MALIIEDGTGVDGAESVATVAELRTYATSRGLTVPTDDTDCEIILRKGMDYIKSIEDRFQGSRYHVGQSLPFPRESLYYFDDYVGPAINNAMKEGQCQLAVDANTKDLLAPGDGREIIEKKIGPLTTKWAETGNSSPQYYPTSAIAILEPLFAPSSGGINILCCR